MKLIRSTLIAHIAAWLLFGTLAAVFLYRDPESGRWGEGPGLFSILLFFLFFISIFYLNSLVLLPRLYVRRKYGWYTVVGVFVLAATIWVKPFDRIVSDAMQRRMELRNPKGKGRPEPARMLPPNEDEFLNWREPDSTRSSFMPPAPGSERYQNPRRAIRRQFRGRLDFASIIFLVATWSLSAALFMIRQWRKTEERVVRAEADKAQAELSFLKAQINPHFLFNTLNNIYSQAISNNPHTAESILKLSNIMRYVTDDIREDFVPLEHEITCMRDYIDLQRLRLGSKMKVQFNVSGEPANRRIVPLVLMTFIENVFKYGISNHDPSLISINLIIEPGSIRFHCSNRIHRATVESERKGVGIANTRQRLEHLYPGKHELTTVEKDGNFLVDLKILD